MNKNTKCFFFRFSGSALSKEETSKYGLSTSFLAQIFICIQIIFCNPSIHIWASTRSCTVRFDKLLKYLQSVKQKLQKINTGRDCLFCERFFKGKKNIQSTVIGVFFWFQIIFAQEKAKNRNKYLIFYRKQKQLNENWKKWIAAIKTKNIIKFRFNS